MRNMAQFLLSMATMTAFLGCIFYMLMKEVPASNNQILNNLISVLITIFTLQMNYFFGSNAASKAKDETIAEIAKSSPAPAMENQPSKKKESI